MVHAVTRRQQLQNQDASFPPVDTSATIAEAPELSSTPLVNPATHSGPTDICTDTSATTRLDEDVTEEADNSMDLMGDGAFSERAAEPAYTAPIAAALTRAESFE